MKKILVVANDVKTSKALEGQLLINGMAVETAFSLREAFSVMVEIAFDLLIVDVSSIDARNEDFEGVDPPILFICEIPKDGYFLKGLTLGTNDYIIRPMRPNELMLKIHALLETPPKERFISCGDLKIDVVKQLVTVRNRIVSLGKKETTILVLLARKSGQIVSHERILRMLGEGSASSGQLFNLHLNELRKRLREAAGEAMRISAFYGGGYRLEFDQAT